MPFGTELEDPIGLSTRRGEDDIIGILMFLFFF
jgi:hypothetical protein